MASEPLLPCPFCGSTDIESRESGPGWMTGHHRCASTWKSNREEAEDAWNCRADTGWIACAERMPPINQRVLASRRHERIEIMRWGPPPDGYGYDLSNPDQPNVWWCGGEKSGVTHWRPLPAPPADIAKKQEAL